MYSLNVCWLYFNSASADGKHSTCTGYFHNKKKVGNSKHREQHLQRWQVYEMEKMFNKRKDLSELNNFWSPELFRRESGSIWELLG